MIQNAAQVSLETPLEVLEGTHTEFRHTYLHKVFSCSGIRHIVELERARKLCNSENGEQHRTEGHATLKREWNVCN